MCFTWPSLVDITDTTGVYVDTVVRFHTHGAQSESMDIVDRDGLSRLYSFRLCNNIDCRLYVFALRPPVNTYLKMSTLLDDQDLENVTIRVAQRDSCSTASRPYRRSGWTERRK